VLTSLIRATSRSTGLQGRASLASFLSKLTGAGMTGSLPKPTWRCIRVAFGQSDVDVNDILDETCGVAVEIAQSPEAAYQVCDQTL